MIDAGDILVHNPSESEFEVEDEHVQYEIVTEKTKYFGHSQREIYIRAWVSSGSEQESLSHFIERMVKALHLDLKFRITDGKGFTKVDFTGRDYKLMLYQNGNLLNAIQYILNRLFSDTIGKKIYCECEKFRRNREFELSNLAHNYAKSVRKNGKSISLKELNPFERRIIHMTINKYSR